MELKDFLLFLGPLLGVVIGSGVAVLLKLVELGHQRRQSDRRLLLEKLESLHQAVTNFPIEFLKMSSAVRIMLSRSPKSQIGLEEYQLAVHSIQKQMAIISHSISLYSRESWVFQEVLFQYYRDYMNVISDILEGSGSVEDLSGFTSKIASTSKTLLAGIEAKIELQSLIVFHEPSSFSENLALAFEKRWRRNDDKVNTAVDEAG